MRLALVLLPLLLIACEEGDDPIVIPDLESNYTLPDQVVSLYDGQEYSSDGPSASGTSITCDLDSGDWTMETGISSGATGAIAFWWDLEDQTAGGAEVLVDGGEGLWARTSTAEDFGRACEDGAFVLVVIPVGSGNVPGVAELAPYLPDTENLINGGGYSKLGLTASFEVATDSTVDAVDLHVLNPYNAVYLGPEALESESPTSWVGEVELDTQLGASEVGSLWIAFAGFSGGELVGVGGL